MREARIYGNPSQPIVDQCVSVPTYVCVANDPLLSVQSHRNKGFSCMVPLMLQYDLRLMFGRNKIIRVLSVTSIICFFRLRMFYLSIMSDLNIC